VLCPRREEVSSSVHRMFMDRRSFHPDDILGYVNGFQIRNV
jgi:hypothetical protein